ncbi:PfkB family carbohydrate kinase [Microbacterium sp. BK668]|uniref:PfkB family carbohydrate kinase n=1 Tax=Microbacterium sp. BK668 TaxID=2512118 RepID=UPI00105F35F5|nr:PfkB family carbohydrate kinase [Microbacterium sp. BK668]TDN91481.1 fructokinase [Microbacterium sp. BK668]
MPQFLSDPSSPTAAAADGGAGSSSTTAVDVLVIGEAVVDITSSAGAKTEMPGGGPANVALGLGRRGVDVALLTNLGRDARGSVITRHLERSGVWVLGESFVDDATSTAHAEITADGSARYDFDVRWIGPEARLGVRPRTIHTGSVAAFLTPGDARVLEQLDRLNAEIVTFDPNIRPALIGARDRARARFEDFARRATVVKLSDEDAEYLYPDTGVHEALDAIAALGPRLVALTRGAHGAALAADGHAVEVPGRTVAVVDTIGAGDTFMASLIADYPSMHDGGISAADLRDLGETAVGAAAITVSRAGADLPWSADLAAQGR